MKPVRFEPKPPIMQSWQDFITASINSCFTEQHCDHCEQLIKLFLSKFNGHIPPYLLEKDLENMFNRLDNRYKSILEQDKLSEVTVDSLIN